MKNREKRKEPYEPGVQEYLLKVARRASEVKKTPKFWKEAALILGILGLCALTVAGIVRADEVTLTLGTQSVNATGYRVYYGTDPADKLFSMDFGMLTEFKVIGLECGTTYHLEVRGYNLAGESEPTNAVAHTTDPCPQLPIIPEGWTIDSLVIKPSS